MKKIALFMMTVALACSMGTFTSCSSDEEELIDNSTVEQYTKDIVGKWLMDGSQWYWRFDAQGGGSVGYGENWDKEDDVNEGEGKKFEWFFDTDEQGQSNGLMVIYFMEATSDYSNPATGAPYSIKSITSTKMTWVTSDGETQSFTRQ